MASNVADVWLFFPAQGAAATTITALDFSVAAVKAVYPIPSRCQVKEWGAIITTTFSANAADPVIALKRRPLISGTSVLLQAITLGSSNTTLRKYTSDPDAVGAGGPGTVNIGPSMGGHTTALAADTSLVAGTICLANTKLMPSTMLQAGDSLLVEVTTGATVASLGLIFVRLEIAGEQYGTAYVQYDATP